MTPTRPLLLVMVAMLPACSAMKASPYHREAEHSADATQSIDTTRHAVPEVVVTTTRTPKPANSLPVTVSTLNRYDLTKNYRQSVLPTATEQVPGLFVTTRSIMGYGVSTGAAGTMKVRGIGGSAALLVLVDGQPQYAGLYGHPIADMMPTMTAERVEVARGPASALYGSNAMGGVINIVTRQAPKTDGTQLQLQAEAGSYGTANGTLTAATRQGRLTANAGAAYSRTDGHRPNMQFNQWTLSAKVGYELSPYWATAVSADLTCFDSSNPGTTDSPLIDNDMDITRGAATASLTNSYDNTSGALRLYYNWGHHHINDGYDADGGTPQTAYYLHDDLMCGASVYQTLKPWRGGSLTIGADFQHFGGKAWNKDMEGSERTMLADATENETAAYADITHQAGVLIVNAALRTDYHSCSGTEIVPQCAATVNLPKGAMLRASVGKGFRNPTIRELYMFTPANDELQPERTYNYELAYSQHLLDGRLYLAANIFYIKAENLITTTVSEGKPLNTNTGATENSGFEAEATLRLNATLSLNTNYSYLHTSTIITAAPRHKAYVGADLTLRRLSLNGGLLYFAKLYTDTSGSTSHAALLNITASYAATPALRLFVKGDNLLAQHYATVDGFPMPKATFFGGLALSL